MKGNIIFKYHVRHFPPNFFLFRLKALNCAIKQIPNASLSIVLLFKKRLRLGIFLDDVQSVLFACKWKFLHENRAERKQEKISQCARVGNLNVEIITIRKKFDYIQS